MSQVLVVEDDPDIIELISLHLNDLGCTVDKAQDGTSGFEKAKTQNFDLIVLDIMLPGMDGVSICQKLRALDIFTPILMLTAKAEEFDKVLGLESGADDYLTKPFGIREFIARVKAMLRRHRQNLQSQENQTDIMRVGDIQIDHGKRRILRGSQKIDLTPKEYDLLVLLATNPGRSYSRDQLLEQVWGYDFSGYEHTVNSHVNRLRAKLEPDLNEPRYILTTWGVGYRFSDEF